MNTLGSSAHLISGGRQVTWNRGVCSQKYRKKCSSFYKVACKNWPFCCLAAAGKFSFHINDNLPIFDRKNAFT